MAHEHIIHLNNVVRIPNTRKANRAIFAIKQYANKHTHAGMKNIHISNDVNELVWARGKNHKINKLKVVFRKKDELTYVFTPEGKDLKTFDKPAKEATAKKAPAKEAAKSATPADSEKTEKVVEKAVSKAPAKKETKTPAEKKEKAQ